MEQERSQTFREKLIGFFSGSNICWVCLGILLLWIAFSGCKKEEVFADPVPFLKIESVSPTTVTEFKDSIIAVLTYDDGDGDLGHFDPDSSALAVTDSRFTEPDLYFIQALAPDVDNLHIRGTLRIALTPPFILGNATQQVISYSIQIRDRAGHLSNTVITPDITLNE